jgi:hypothetical protein
VIGVLPKELLTARSLDHLLQRNAEVYHDWLFFDDRRSL